jgi:hypothetical protein
MAHGTYNNPRAGTNSSKNRMKSMINKINDPKKSTLDKSDKISQNYMLPEISISSKVEEQWNDKGGKTYNFTDEKPYYPPNPKATKSNPKDIKKKISNSPSSREMEVEREEQDWLNDQTDPTPDKDYYNFIKSTGRFPQIWK